MPTKNRREFVPKAIEYFLRQTYPNKLLVILDDGESVKDLCIGRGVEYHRVSAEMEAPQTLGAKRNLMVNLAPGRSPGDLIAHWDDDDWYGPERLAIQVEAMRGFEICGLSDPLFYDLKTGRSYQYHPRGAYAYSATLMYTREYWARGPFPDVQVASATPFVARAKVIGMMPEQGWYVGMAHDSNNSPKVFSAAEFTPFNFDKAARFNNVVDWSFYQGLRERMGVAA
jgi:glycosyltransferase involved in cell wall biosynthesis